MSSSSSGEQIATSIERSLSRLWWANPDGHRRVLERGAGLAAWIEIGQETCSVRFGEDRVDVGSGREDAALEVRSDRSTIAAVLSGRLPLATAVLEGRLTVRGPVVSVMQAHDVLIEYVAACAHDRAQHATAHHMSGMSERGERRPRV